MDPALQQPIRKFNPGLFQSDEEVISQFVVRKIELQTVLEVLHDNAKSPACQPILVIAPRGQGKSMLLARVAAELHVNEKFAELLPVRFMEESHEIFDIADFWLETLLHLSREVAESHPELAQELRTAHAALPARWQEDELARRAHAAVEEAAGRLGRKLVLMVENFQALRANTNELFGWKLRACLQTNPNIMLLATATGYFPELQDATQPFFDAFYYVDLKPLSTSDCGRLWQTLCGNGKAGHEHKIRTLEILTGGNPRLLAIIGKSARHRSPHDLMETLVELVDSHTEYFRNHLEALPKTERRVYLAAIDLWRPSSASEIAARARMDIRTVSSLLTRLARRGAVTAHGSGKKRRYAAAERLHSIYYKLRHGRDATAVVQNLVHFMAAFYSAERQWDDMYSQLATEMEPSRTAREGMKRAITEPLRIAPDAPEPEAAEKTKPESDTIGHRIKQQIEKADAAYRDGKYEACIAITDQSLNSRHLDEMPSSCAAPMLLQKAFSHEQLGDHNEAVEVLDRVVRQFQGSHAPDLRHAVAWALFAKGFFCEMADEYGTAIEAYSEALDRSGSGRTKDLQEWSVRALVGSGNAKRKRDDFEGALADYARVVDLFGTRRTPLFRICVSQALLATGHVHEMLGNTSTAIASYEEVIRKFGASNVREVQASVAMASRCKRMCEHWLHRTDNPTGLEWPQWVAYMQALLLCGELRLAMHGFRSVRDAFAPSDKASLDGLVDAAMTLAAQGAPVSELVEILSGNSGDSDALFPLIAALRQHDGEDVRAPDEVLDVAADIRTRIHEKQDEHHPEAS